MCVCQGILVGNKAHCHLYKCRRPCFDGDRYQRQGRTLLIGDFPGERNFVLCRQT